VQMQHRVQGLPLGLTEGLDEGPGEPSGSDDTRNESRSRKSEPEQTGVKVRQSGRMLEKVECLGEATVGRSCESDDSGDDI